MQRNLALAGALLLVLIVQVVVASQQIVIDDGEPTRIVINKLCPIGQNKYRISRASTIPKLHDYFSSTYDVNLKQCADTYVKPLADLKSLLEISNENVCSYETMHRIEHFHWHYVVGTLSKKWHKASTGTLPEALKIFFMNYANEVTERCKDTLAERLEFSAASNTQVQAESLMSNKFGLIINQLGNILNPRDGIEKHDDFLLIFEHLADKERKRGSYIVEPVDLATEDTIMMSFKVSDAEGAWAIQKKCRRELRPVYRNTVLPVMRLISIGYGNEERRPREDVTDNELVKNWYAITQFCQLVLPVNFHQDRSLQSGQAKAITEEEARELIGMPVSGGGSSSSRNGVDYLVAVQPVHLDDKLAASTYELIVKQVKYNLKSRSNIYGRVLRNVFTLINGRLKTKLKNLFFSKKVGDKKFVVESGDVALGKLKAASKTDKAISRNDGDEEDREWDENNISVDHDEKASDNKVEDNPTNHQKVEVQKVAPGFFKKNRTQLIVGTGLLIGFGLAIAFIVYLIWTSVVTLLGIGASVAMSFG